MTSRYRCFHCDEIVEAGETHSHALPRRVVVKTSDAITTIPRRVILKTTFDTLTTILLIGLTIIAFCLNFSQLLYAETEKLIFAGFIGSMASGLALFVIAGRLLAERYL